VNVAHALDIATWRYPAPDDCYDMTDALIMSASFRQNPAATLLSMSLGGGRF
jgi:hypothetical protein